MTWLGLAALLPTLAVAASISGTVSDEGTHVGIAGVEVCPTPQPYTFETECTETDSSGHYSLASLPPAEYMLDFSGSRNNLRYVNEFYDNKTSNLDADLVALNSPEASRQIDVELAEGGSISGTVIDEETKEPIEGLAACAWNGAGDYQRCDISDAAGSFEINGLPSDEFYVEYEGWNRVNYIREFYEDAPTVGQATKVSVAAPSTTSGIDAELARGAEILGHVSDVTTGVPIEGSMVCAPLQSGEDNDVNCDWSDSSGNYAIRGLPAGTYVVGFDVGFAGPFGGPSVGQWWQEASTKSEATPLELSTPQTVAGIDGKVSRPYWPSSAPESEAAPPSTPMPAPVVKRSLPKCKKGFHRKLVKGKKRCVRKHRRHHRPRG